MDKGGRFDDQTINAIVDGADRIVKGVTKQNKANAGALAGLGALTTAIAKAMNAQNDRFADLAGKVDAITKALGVPVQPRALTGVQPAKTPAEIAAGDGSGNVDPELVKAKITKGLHESTTSERRYQLAAAAADLDSGVSAKQVAERYNIPLV